MVFAFFPGLTVAGIADDLGRHGGGGRSGSGEPAEDKLELVLCTLLLSLSSHGRHPVLSAMLQVCTLRGPAQEWSCSRASVQLPEGSDSGWQVFCCGHPRALEELGLYWLPSFPAGPGHPGGVPWTPVRPVLRGRSRGGRFGRPWGFWGPRHTADAHPHRLWPLQGCSVIHADLRSQRLPVLGALGWTQWTVALGLQRMSLAWPSLRNDAVCFCSSCWALHVALQLSCGCLWGRASHWCQLVPSLALGPRWSAIAGADRHRVCSLPRKNPC